MSSRLNLDKLKQLCDELTDRDEQLKINASALWEILEIVSAVTKDLSEIEEEKCSNYDLVRKCVSKLEEVSCIIASKGCKKVIHEH